GVGARIFAYAEAAAANSANASRVFRKVAKLAHPHRHRRPGISDRRIRLLIERKRSRSARSHPADADLALAGHSRIAALTRADGERLRALVPPERNARIFTVQVLAADSVVL